MSANQPIALETHARLEPLEPRVDHVRGPDAAAAVILESSPAKG